jgi:uncharacterized protein DUF1996
MELNSSKRCSSTVSFCNRIAVTALVAAVAVAAPLGTRALTDGGGTLHGSNFFSNCPFSHTSMDDPIVYQGEPGRSHAHTFFGNTSTDASSSLSSLRKARTTCRPKADKAAYWVPTLYLNGREIRPAKAQLYYVLHGYDRMQAFPAGLRVIAGDAHAARPQSVRVTYWTCGGQAARTPASSRVPAHCGIIEGHGLMGGPDGKVKRVRWKTKSWLELHVNFPDCWDGNRLDSPDHHSHMAYSRQYRCPSSHPVKVPLIRLMIRYAVDRGAGVTLASGGPETAHADFFNAWNQKALERLVATCFHERGCRPY